MSTELELEVYVVILNGLGDFQGMVIDKTTFTWLDSDWPDELGFASSGDETDLPELLKEALARNGEEETAFITRGSYINDRALSCLSTIKGFKPIYDDFHEMFTAIERKGYNVVNTMNGAIY